ncbi:MAG: sialidase family protein [Pirellulaceae bacterium]|nr:sialidase family protein [Pirellulaceae bacterium]MDP7019095.1 sialidase family protein [Pirellulaceae bacterium]
MNRVLAARLPSLCVVGWGVCLGTVCSAEITTPIVGKPGVNTERLGDRDVPPAEVLKRMHRGDYILHARAGELARVSVEKTRLPPDSEATPQTIRLVKSPRGAIYACLKSRICKSEDAGRTWTSHRAAAEGVDPPRGFQVLKDGTFIGIAGGSKPGAGLSVMTSTDEGRSWTKRSALDIPKVLQPYLGKYWDSLHQLSDGTLLFPLDVRRKQTDPKAAAMYGEQWTAICFRSTDGGESWEAPREVCHWWAGAEGGVAETPSGKLLAVIRYQRPLLPGDPADLVNRNGGYTNWPYKTVFLADSKDQGRTWTNFRQLCTRFGQTRGYPLALGDGAVVVVHDTRYGPGSPGSRAMISRDEGRSWEDEVYYLDFTTFSGSYAASVALEDGRILTVTGSSQAGNSWEAVKGKTDFIAIQWKLVPSPR